MQGECGSISIPQESLQAMHDCAARSLAGAIRFSEVVGRLAVIGAERYCADFNLEEITYYLPDGATHVVAAPHPPQQLSQAFKAADVNQAIRHIQRGAILYVEFVRQIMAAGCVGYFVQISGRRALSFGRQREVHVEPFPAAPPTR